MQSLGSGYHAVVIGASGGIGHALTNALSADPACAVVHAFSRSGALPGEAGIRPGRIDITREETIEQAAETARAAGRISLVVIATGFLHDPDQGPEKSWNHLTPEGLARNFALNATGPALVAKHFLPLMPREGRSVFAALSARVGSISDNSIGGWYGYRASKAALNQLLKCFAIEAARKRPDLVVAGLQPGTVRTPLSAPFRGHVSDQNLFDPATAADNLLGVLDTIPAERSGRMFDWAGKEVPP